MRMEWQLARRVAGFGWDTMMATRVFSDSEVRKIDAQAALHLTKDELVAATGFENVIAHGNRLRRPLFSSQAISHRPRPFHSNHIAII